ncbi:MAG: rhodanese-like domain-containing protein [Chloroflexota bacterium]|nr:rhodanese-like domain-containing protein [Chloroflexota bacterium]
MPTPITPDDLHERLSDDAPIALIDVRDPPEYNASHIVGASLIPRRMLEFELPEAVPHRDTPIVLCDEDERRVHFAAETVERMGYSDVSTLSGGTNRWAFLDLPTEWGVNVPSKDFGERVEVVHHVPEIDADDLHERIERGDSLVILDTRTPEEYRRACIPGGRSMPGGELALRITDVLADAPDDATVVVNCAGRTRSIIGTRVLQRMALEREVVGLKNGTAGWMLAGHGLEFGADRDALPAVTAEGQAAAERYARRCAEEDGVQLIGVEQLDELRERSESESVYFIDVRTDTEHEAGHIPGFRWFPGGQAVQRSDDVAIVHHAPIVFACDGVARAALTASWYRQMGHRHIYALDGGIGAWTAAGRSLDVGPSVAEPALLAEARGSVRLVDPLDAFDPLDARVVHVGTSQEFAEGHPPGAEWEPRGDLEADGSFMAAYEDSPLIIVCEDGRQSLLAAQTVESLGHGDVSVMQGGMVAYREERLPIEEGLSGVLTPPNDILTFGPQRGYADMQHYLRWETALGEKYVGDSS